MNKIKIVHIINSLVAGGAEKLVADSVPIYEKNNTNVDVLLLKDNNSFFRKELEGKMEGKVIGLTKKSIYNPLLIFKIIPYLKKYDVVHAHLFPTLYWVVLAKVLSFSKTSIIYTEHSTSNRRRSHFLLKYIDKYIYERVEITTCISKGVYNELHKFLNRKKKLLIINNGVNLNLYTFKGDNKMSFFSKDSFTLIQVSRFSSAKDQDTVVRSLQYLPENVKLLLVGDGVLRAEKEYLVNKLNLTERVKFLGNRKDIPELLAYADVAVLSSHYEGFGLVAVEGMAAGKPVVASNVEGLKEVVKGYGVLFEKGNEKDLAQKITKLLQDKNHYDTITEKCKKRAKDFSIEKMVQKYLKLYEDVKK